MAETAAHLVDRVLPHVPMRQWVLSVPHGLRYRMAYDADLLSRVMRIFSRVVFQSLRLRAYVHPSAVFLGDSAGRSPSYSGSARRSHSHRRR